MKKNTKILIASAAGIAALGTAVAVLLLTAPGDEVQSTVSSADDSSVIFAYNSDDISTLTVSNADGEFTINRLGSGKWGIDGIPQEYADNNSYGSAISNAAEISADMLVEMDAEDLDKYGFGEPTATFAITFKDDKYEPVTCTVGLKNEGENAWYFKTDESDAVYLVSNATVSFAMDKRLDYVKLSGLTPSFDSETDIVNRIRISRPDLDRDIVLDKLAEKTDDREFASTYVGYKISSHNDILADDELDLDLVYGLFDLSASSAVAVNPTDEQLAEYGISSPLCVASMVNNEEITKLTVGSAVYDVETNEETGEVKKTLTGYYGMIQGIDVVYIFPESVIPYVTVNVEDILYRLFLSPYIYYVDDVTVTTPDASYEFKINGDADESSITLDGKEIDRPSFTTFYQYLLSCYAEEIYVEPLTEENEFLFSFTYDYREDWEGEDKVELYSSESDRTCIIVVNGDVRYKIRRIYGTRFLTNLEALLTGGELSTDF